MEQLTIHEKVGANYLLLELFGAMSAYTITELQDKVFTSIVDSNVVLDLEQVSQIDSSGMSVIFAGHNDGLQYGTKLFIMNPSTQAEKALNKTGFMDFFNIIHSVTEVSDEK